MGLKRVNAAIHVLSRTSLIPTLATAESTALLLKRQRGEVGYSCLYKTWILLLTSEPICNHNHLCLCNSFSDGQLATFSHGHRYCGKRSNRSWLSASRAAGRPPSSTTLSRVGLHRVEKPTHSPSWRTSDFMGHPRMRW